MVLNHRLSNLAKVLSASAIILLGYYILKFHNQLQLPSSLNANKTSINFRAKTQPLIEGFELIEYYKGMKVFSLKAKQLYLRNRKVEPFGFRVALGKTAELQDVDVTFFANNEPVSCLHSNKAILNQKDKSIIFQDKPFMLTKNHRSLSAQEIKWDNISRSIHAQGNCVLSGDGVSQQAESIQTDITLE